MPLRVRTPPRRDGSKSRTAARVFLDEIGDLPLELQAKLLRVIQEGNVERLGSTRTTHVDVRIIAATNRDLLADVHSGRFRRDLYYRLNVFPIAVPALRERRGDLPALVGHLVVHLSRALGKAVTHIDPSALPALARHDWPGNIRELENVLQRGIILSKNGAIDLSDFTTEPVVTSAAPSADARPRSLADTERDYVRRVLEQLGWRIEGPAGAARVLGLQPSTLRSKMRQLDLCRPGGWRRIRREEHAPPIERTGT